MKRVLDSFSVQVMVTILTIISLFGDDLRLASAPKNLDLLFDIPLFFAFVIFLFEMIGSIYAKKGYLFSFFFWLDLIAQLSLLTDIYFLLTLLTGDSSLTIPTDATNVARAGRATRAGTKAGRILKMMRLIKLVRVAKFYKETKRTLKLNEKRIRMKSLNQDHNNSFLEDKKDEEEFKPPTVKSGFTAAQIIHRRSLRELIEKEKKEKNRGEGVDHSFSSLYEPGESFAIPARHPVPSTFRKHANGVSNRGTPTHEHTSEQRPKAK